MIGFFEQFNRDYVGLALDPDHTVVGMMLAEKYGIRFRESGNEIELQFVSRPVYGAEKTPAKKAQDGRWAVWPGVHTDTYNASMCISVRPGTEDTIRSFYIKHWVETERGCEAANILMTDEEFMRGIAILQEYLDKVAVVGKIAECRWQATA